MVNFFDSQHMIADKYIMKYIIFNRWIAFFQQNQSSFYFILSLYLIDLLSFFLSLSLTLFKNNLIFFILILSLIVLFFWKNDFFLLFFPYYFVVLNFLATKMGIDFYLYEKNLILTNIRSEFSRCCQK